MKTKNTLFSLSLPITKPIKIWVKAVVMLPTAIVEAE